MNLKLGFIPSQYLHVTHHL